MPAISRPRVRAGRGVARLNVTARLQFILAIGDDHISRVYPAGDDRRVALRQRNRDWLILNRISGLTA